ncbi:MAG: hypothetical protein Alis3KO_00300 [Aliiglaciecola sp.]|uniref:hypothetical protein n=1 Tax=Aliiglaciecola sp. M165 TaxID=2593649 RepID=UPI00117FF7A8|nr:hypothetical protein [Aliiglaciecola sp. M165]TRY32366.1 hypothetical protein FM019_05845 [Aliiglaciecola sp. M165]
MKTSAFSKILFLFFAVLALQACDTNKKKGAGKYGMMDTNTPDYAAVAFFEHIYRDKNLNNALAMSTPRMAKILKSYHTNRNVQRHVIDLTYDEVEIQPDTGNSVGRNEFAKSAVVTLFFTGTIHGDRVEDIRIVEMVRIDGKWLVDRVQADKYL